MSPARLVFHYSRGRFNHHGPRTSHCGQQLHLYGLASNFCAAISRLYRFTFDSRNPFPNYCAVIFDFSTVFPNFSNPFPNFRNLFSSFRNSFPNFRNLFSSFRTVFYSGVRSGATAAYQVRTTRGSGRTVATLRRHISTAHPLPRVVLTVMSVAPA